MVRDQLPLLDDSARASRVSRQDARVLGAAIPFDGAESDALLRKGLTDQDEKLSQIF